MTEFCNNHRDDWELFALGTLSEKEREQMSAHLRSGCPECAKLFMEAQAVVAALGTTPESEDPSPAVELRLAERLRADAAKGLEQATSPAPQVMAAAERGISFWIAAPWVLAALFFALFVASERAYLKSQKESLEAGQLNPVKKIGPAEPQSPNGNPDSATNERELQSTIEQLRAQLDQANQQMADSQREAARLSTDLKAANLQVAALQSSIKDAEEQRIKAEADAASIRLQLAKVQDDEHRGGSLAEQNRQMAKLLESPQLHQLPLKVVNPLGGEADARVVWDDDRGLMLLAHNLPQLPQRRVYQLWILRKGTPPIASAGLVQVDSRGRGTAYVPPGDDLNNMAGVVVTDEPPGGSTSSRGSQVLLGKP